MRFLVDESTGKRLANLLLQDGHDVVYVGDVMPSASDDMVLEKAERDDRVLVTDDKDFGELVFRMGKPSNGVILLRTSTVSPKERFDTLQDLFDTVEEVERKFIVLTEHAVRVRNL